MKVQCVEKTAANRMKQLGDVGYTPQSVFALTVNKTYPVYGMCVDRGILCYLMVDDQEMPRWFPSVLFEVTDRHIPSDWSFDFWGRDPKNLVTAIWGYKELVWEEGYFDALSQVEPSAIEIFKSRVCEPHKD